MNGSARQAEPFALLAAHARSDFAAAPGIGLESANGMPLTRL
jgi:hypothetical protein